jgi:hypothetical protein
VLTARIRKPLANFSLLALLAFIVLGLVRERHLLTAQLLPQLLIVVLHNAAGLLLGWLAARPSAWTSATAAPSPSKAACRTRAWRWASSRCSSTPTWAWSSSPACGASGTSSVGHVAGHLWRRKDARLGH